MDKIRNIYTGQILLKLEGVGQFKSESKSVSKITVGLENKFLAENISTIIGRFEFYLLLTTFSYLSAKESCKTLLC